MVLGSYSWSKIVFQPKWQSRVNFQHLIWYQWMTHILNHHKELFLMISNLHKWNDISSQILWSNIFNYLWPRITTQHLHGLPSFFICEDNMEQCIGWHDDMEIPWFVTFLFHSVDIELCHKLWHILSMLYIDRVYWVVSIYERTMRIYKGVG